MLAVRFCVCVLSRPERVQSSSLDAPPSMASLTNLEGGSARARREEAIRSRALASSGEFTDKLPTQHG